MIELDAVINLETLVYVGAIGLVAIGALGLALSNHLFRMLLALGIAESGANLLLILSGYRPDATAPIIGYGPVGASMVDPLPQVLVLTAIVIGVGVQAMAVAMLVRVFRVYGTLDVRELRKRMELEVSTAAGMPVPTSEQAPAGERPLPPVPAYRPSYGPIQPRES
jgi:multisubunit Na+/H+ antiporter MnhC subunit